MPIFIVSYDISEENRDEYEELWDQLDDLESQKVQKSVYLVAAKASQYALYERIKNQLGSGDKLLVAEITKLPSVSEKKININNWLRKWFIHYP